MKNLLYIFFIIVVSSCGSSKELRKEVLSEDKSNKTEQNNNVDNNTKTENSEDSKEEPIVLATEEPRQDGSSKNQTKNSIKEKQTSKPVVKSNQTETKIENITVKDNTKSTDKPNFGLVAYSVPKNMQVGKTYTVKLRISKEKNKVQIVDGDGIPIADSKIESNVTISSIRVEPIMSAKLISDSSKMLIQTTSTQIQDIEKEGFTEWEWRLSPISGGEILIKIMVSIVVDSDNSKVTKDIPVYDDVVKVKSNVVFSITGFVKNYWQWLMTTIVIPFVVWFYNRKKKKENS